MQRPLKALLAVFIASAVIPGIASAKDISVGVTKTPVTAYTCPSSVKPIYCKIALTKITALEAKSDGVAYPTTITTNGLIDSFTLGVSALSSNKATVKKDLEYLDSTWGGGPEVRLTVLRPVGKSIDHNWRVAAQSPVFPIISYLGKVVEMPLIAPLAVTRGEVLALTVPTWAAVLSLGSGKQFQYRQSRSTVCTGEHQTETLNPLTITGQFANFGCTYSGSRVEFSALEVASPAG